MGLHMVKAVPTPEEIRAAHPMDKELQEIKAKRDADWQLLQRRSRIRFL